MEALVVEIHHPVPPTCWQISVNIQILCVVSAYIIHTSLGTVCCVDDDGGSPPFCVSDVSADCSWPYGHTYT